MCHGKSKILPVQLQAIELLLTCSWVAVLAWSASHESGLAPSCWSGCSVFVISGHHWAEVSQYLVSCRPVCSQWQQSGLNGVVAGSGGGCPMLVAEECVAELRGSSAPLHGRHPAHWRLHGVPNGTLWYAELKSLRNAYEPRTNIPAEAAIPVILVFHGCMYSFIWRPSAMTRNGSSTSFFGTKPNGTKLVGLKPGGHTRNQILTDHAIQESLVLFDRFQVGMAAVCEAFLHRRKTKLAV